MPQTWRPTLRASPRVCLAELRLPGDSRRRADSHRGGGPWLVHPSRFTGYSITKREADTLTMPLADPSLPRIDRIVMRYDAGARAASLQVLQGTASSTPTAPAISRTELTYDLCLAEIARPAGSTSISTGQTPTPGWTRRSAASCGTV